MKFLIDVDLKNGANPVKVAEEIHNYLCQEDIISGVFSCNDVEPHPVTDEEKHFVMAALLEED